MVSPVGMFNAKCTGTELDADGPRRSERFPEIAVAAMSVVSRVNVGFFIAFLLMAPPARYYSIIL